MDFHNDDLARSELEAIANAPIDAGEAPAPWIAFPAIVAVFPGDDETLKKISDETRRATAVKLLNAARSITLVSRTMGADKRKADLSDSDDDFAPSAEASPEVKPKPKKKSKPKAASDTKPKPELADDDDGTQASPKDKKKKEAALDYGVDITTYDQSPELTAKYSAMSVTELNQWLKANRVVKGAANKANMVARCVDGELFGAFPPCPRCVTGKLKVTYASLDAHGGQGEWTCRGAFDEAIGMRVKCYFTARPGEVTRLQWRDMHDPAPEPEKPGGGAGTTTTDDAKFPDGFETFIPKDAANAVKAIALAMGFQLPAEGANSEIGEFLFIFGNFLAIFGNGLYGQFD